MAQKLNDWYAEAINLFSEKSKREPEWHKELVKGDSVYDMTFRNDPMLAESVDFLGKKHLIKALDLIKKNLDYGSAKKILELHSKGEKCWYCPKALEK